MFFITTAQYGGYGVTRIERLIQENNSMNLYVYSAIDASAYAVPDRLENLSKIVQ